MSTKRELSRYRSQSIVRATQYKTRFPGLRSNENVKGSKTRTNIARNIKAERRTGTSKYNRKKS